MAHNREECDMTLRERAATALDQTHEPELAYRGPTTMKLRSLIAAWLDGKKMRLSVVRKSISYLEMIVAQDRKGRVMPAAEIKALIHQWHATDPTRAFSQSRPAKS
jgi:hypothetical protein